MIQYQCKVGTPGGDIQEIAFQSEDELSLREELAEKGYHILRIRSSLGLAMLIIGAPLWFFFWKNVQRNVSGNTIEIGSALRKFYLNLILVADCLYHPCKRQQFPGMAAGWSSTGPVRRRRTGYPDSVCCHLVLSLANQ